MLLHLIDGTADDPVAAYRSVRRELEAYGNGLAEKPELVALNKADALSPEDAAAKTARLAEAIGKEVALVSGASGQGLTDALRSLYRYVGEATGAAEAPAEAGAWRP